MCRQAGLGGNLLKRVKMPGQPTAYLFLIQRLSVVQVEGMIVVAHDPQGNEMQPAKALGSHPPRALGCTGETSRNTVPPLGGFLRYLLFQDRLKAELRTIYASALKMLAREMNARHIL
jgi:hypothetical protein